jgi:hypothetical protein
MNEEQRESRKQYKKVVNIVYHNTTKLQPAMMHARNIRVIAGYGGMSGKTVNSKLRRAVKNGDLITDGKRFCVTHDKERLQRAANKVAKQVPVDRNLLGKINKCKMNL